MKTSRRMVLLTGAAFLLALGFVFTPNFVDFPVYYAAGRSLLVGRTDLYSPDFALGSVMDYRYPPWFVVAISPLCRFSYGVSAWVWYVMLAASVICIFVVADR